MSKNSFHVSEKEQELIDKWLQEEVYPVIKNNLEYRFVRSSIGTSVTVYCKEVKLDKNITDYDNW